MNAGVGLGARRMCDDKLRCRLSSGPNKHRSEPAPRASASAILLSGEAGRRSPRVSASILLSGEAGRRSPRASASAMRLSGDAGRRSRLSSSRIGDAGRRSRADGAVLGLARQRTSPLARTGPPRNADMPSPECPASRSREKSSGATSGRNGVADWGRAIVRGLGSRRRCGLGSGRRIGLLCRRRSSRRGSRPEKVRPSSRCEAWSRRSRVASTRQPRTLR